jgi:DNA-binding transcriptional ArsR family regulator
VPSAAASHDAFRAIAEKNRRVLLDLLHEGERPVGDLVEATGLSYPLVSQHLQVLVGAALVTRRQDGRRRMYRLDAAPLRVVHDWTAEYKAFWSARLREFRRHLDA